MACARVKLPDGMDMLLRPEMEEAINQTNLGREDAAIAKAYLIDHIPQIDIAVEYGYDRSAISRRVPKIIAKVTQTAKKLNMLD